MAKSKKTAPTPVRFSSKPCAPYTKADNGLYLGVRGESDGTLSFELPTAEWLGADCLDKLASGSSANSAARNTRALMKLAAEVDLTFVPMSEANRDRLYVLIANLVDTSNELMAAIAEFRFLVDQTKTTAPWVVLTLARKEHCMAADYIRYVLKYAGVDLVAE